jgi:hypothetical protein
VPKYQQPADHIHESVEQAWRADGERGAVAAIIVKYAKVLDMTDSGRDIKPLATGMLEAVDRLKALDASSTVDTPIAEILREANEVLANA